MFGDGFENHRLIVKIFPPNFYTTKKSLSIITNVYQSIVFRSLTFFSTDLPICANLYQSVKIARFLNYQSLPIFTNRQIKFKKYQSLPMAVGNLTGLEITGNDW